MDKTTKTRKSQNYPLKSVPYWVRLHQFVVCRASVTMETCNPFSECTLKEIVCEHFELFVSSTPALNLRMLLFKPHSQSGGWLSLCGRRRPATLGIWTPFHMKQRYTFLQRLEDELLFSWEGHRPLVAQMNQLIMASSELEAKQKEKNPPYWNIHLHGDFFPSSPLSVPSCLCQLAPLVQGKS